MLLRPRLLVASLLLMAAVPVGWRQAGVSRFMPFAAASAQSALTSISVGDAVVTADPGQQVWTIGNAQVQVRLGLTAARTFVIDEISNPSTGRVLTAAAEAESAITLNGNQVTLGGPGWALTDVALAETPTGVRAGFTFRSATGAFSIVRWYACYAGAPAIETWTVVRASGAEQATVTAPSMWRVVVPTRTFRYVQGLRQAGPDPSGDASFARQNVAIGAGQQLTLTESNRSSETYVPLIAAEAGPDSFFGGVMWSGSWEMTATGLAVSSRVTASLPRLTTTVSTARPLETPHAIFGVVEGGQPAVARAVRSFVVQGLKEGRELAPLVTYNTWFAYGTDIDAQSVSDEMAVAAGLGVELFVVDAGWYAGVGRGSDFSPGLGSWQVDAARFPGGLAPLREYAHELGMRFGVWVEPERVDGATVGRAGLVREEWLAQRDGKYPSTTPQVCLASQAALSWLVGRVTQFLDEVQPDYLKWDNNEWVNCNRGGHGHASADGNFRHVEGLYSLLATLRERYPQMEIENCSQGGNRLDLGMLRYTDAAWMDDRTIPARHVRHNLQGLMAFFPPAYLLSFAMNGVDEPLSADADLPLYMRSRMPGALGLSYRADGLNDADRERLAAEIALYKSLRGDLQNAHGQLLTGQAASSDGPAWDVVQETSAISGNVIVFAFHNDPGIRSIVVQIDGLDRNATYVINDAGGALLGGYSGAEIMDNGLPIDYSTESDAQIFTFRKIG